MKLPKAVIKDLEQILTTNPNVMGYSATTKDKPGRGKKLTKVVRIYIERALPKGKVNPRLRLPRVIRGFPVDVVVIGKVELAQSPGARKMMVDGATGHIEKFRPLQGGISACNAQDGAGTLGYFLRDDTNPPAPQKPQWYILSCEHVLHEDGSPEETIQPSAPDKGQYPGDLVGKLTEKVLNLRIDAAIAQIDVGAEARIVAAPSPVKSKKVKEAMVTRSKFLRHHTGSLVEKSGRTTGTTIGWIIDGDLRLQKIKYPDGVDRDFKDCLLIESVNEKRDFALPGDSGSLLLDAGDQTAIGLICWASTMSAGVGSRGIACRMEHVLTAFPGKILVKPGESWP